MLFKDVVGQQDIRIRLIQMVREHRIGHALMFAGGEGSGNLGLAIAFARYINCLNPDPEDSCSECASCRKYSKLAHPDLHLIFPVAETKESGKDPVSDDFIGAWRECILANPYTSLFRWYEHIGIEKKQGSINRSESLQIIRKLSFKNFEATYKVVIIWMAEKMNLSASNKLLKILEEPPENTVFILVSGEVNQIIPTIFSRTQLIHVPRIDSESMALAIREKHTITDQSRIDSLVRLADGNYLQLTGSLEEVQESANRFEMFVSLMRMCFARDFGGISDWIDKMAVQGREKQKQFFQYALRMIRGNFILNIEAGDIDLLSEEERDFSIKFSKFVHPGNIFPIYDELNKASIHIECNGYSRLILFDLSVKIARLLKP